MEKSDLTGSVYPRPRRWRPGAGHFTLTAKARLAAADDSARSEANILRDDLATLTSLHLRSAARANNGDIRLIVDPQLPPEALGDEAYVAEVTPQHVTLRGRTERGLFYAGRTLLDLLRPGQTDDAADDGLGLAIPCGTIVDWPAFDYRGVMNCPSGGFIDPQHMRWQMDVLARNKLNVLHVHFCDVFQFALPTRRYPKLNDSTAATCERPGVYTRQQVRQLVREATKRKIRLIPEIDMPGHATYWLAQHPELQCDAPDPSTRTLCVGKEATYRMIEGLIDEIAPLFADELFHIGTDELHFADATDRVKWSWPECRDCRRRMADEGLTDMTGLFYYFVRRVHGMLARHGKRLMMWNDNIDVARPIDLPRDIVMQFWRIASPPRGPHRGCSFNRLAAAGFEVVNSFFRDTYLDTHVREDRILDWHPHRRPPSRRENRDRIIGGEACLWGVSDDYDWLLPTFAATFGDRLWHGAPIRDPDHFARGIARHVFGPRTPPELDRLLHVDGRLARNAAARHEDIVPVLSPVPARQPEAQRRMMLAALDAAVDSGLVPRTVSTDGWCRRLRNGK
jgi:hypothetical protein